MNRFNNIFIFKKIYFYDDPYDYYKIEVENDEKKGLNHPQNFALNTSKTLQNRFFSSPNGNILVKKKLVPELISGRFKGMYLGEILILEIDWGILNLREMCQILEEKNGYIDGDRKTVVVEV